MHNTSGVDPVPTLAPGSSSLRPKVSFNRAVHVKRIRDRLADLAEQETDEDSGTAAGQTSAAPAASTATSTPASTSRPPYREMKRIPENGYATLPPRRSANGSSGWSTDPDPVSSRAERIIPIRVSGATQTTAAGPIERKKKSWAEKMRTLFSGSSKKKAKQTQTDDLALRYKEFKPSRNSSSDLTTDNEIDYDVRDGSRRRDSGSGLDTSRRDIYNSIDRLNKTGSLKYPTESDSSDHQLNVSRLRRLNVRGGESPTTAELNRSQRSSPVHRTPSLIYLHQPKVGDLRSATPRRRVHRSVSVSAPWAPTSFLSRRPAPPSRGTEGSSNSNSNKPPLSSAAVTQTSSSKSLPKLVFTGPSIEATIRRQTSNSTQMRSRK